MFCASFPRFTFSGASGVEGRLRAGDARSGSETSLEPSNRSLTDSRTMARRRASRWAGRSHLRSWRRRGHLGQKIRLLVGWIRVCVETLTHIDTELSGVDE